MRTEYQNNQYDLEQKYFEKLKSKNMRRARDMAKNQDHIMI